jgi:hypothetical protein
MNNNNDVEYDPEREGICCISGEVVDLDEVFIDPNNKKIYSIEALRDSDDKDDRERLIYWYDLRFEEIQNMWYKVVGKCKKEKEENEKLKLQNESLQLAVKKINELPYKEDYCPWNHCDYDHGDAIYDDTPKYYNKKYDVILCKECYCTTTEGKLAFNLIE